MTNVNEVYKCDLCGNIVRVVHAGFILQSPWIVEGVGYTSKEP
jgi:desulfoferrodoxin-like iron-binding protein